MALLGKCTRFLYLGMLLLAAAGPTLVKAHTFDTQCFTNELRMSLGEKSPTYLWSKNSSKKHTAKLSPIAPPSAHPSIVTVTRFESRFPMRTPIQIDGFENFEASYIGSDENKATVAIFAELKDLNAQMFHLPAKGEVFNPATLKTESYYIVEEKGHPVFYPNQETAHSKLGGKSFSQIGKGAEQPDHPRFHLTLSRGEQHQSIDFFKNPKGNDWAFILKVDESKVRPLESVKLLNATDFERKYPHNTNDLSKPQTLFLANNEEFLLSGYNPETGMVTVEKDYVKIVYLKVDPDHPNELITSDDIKLRRILPQTSQTPKSRPIHRPIQPGDLFLGSDGFTYELRSYHSQDQAKAFLRRTEQREMTLSVFEDSLKTSKQFKALNDIPNSNQKEIVDTEQGFFGKMKTFLGSLGIVRRQVQLLGTQNVSRLAVKNTSFKGHSKNISGKEITYQIHGPNGDSNLNVRVSKSSLTNLDLKRIDVLVSQIASSQVDAVRSIVLIDETTARALQPPDSIYKPAAGRCHSDRTVEIIDFFKRTPGSSAKTLWHEMGHAIAQKLWNSFQPDQEWVRAAVLDGHFISGYSLSPSKATSLVEDIAETVAAYIATDGGRTQPGLRQAFKNRFEYLDRAIFPH